jgi:hypothetical protein
MMVHTAHQRKDSWDSRRASFKRGGRFVPLARRTCVPPRGFISPPRDSASRARGPVVYYIHGGPQGQERPDFAWFSMPLIQYLTLRGFAVFVPNVRGSTGYGLSYTKHVDRDWGGQDRLDHVVRDDEGIAER